MPKVNTTILRAIPPQKKFNVTGVPKNWLEVLYTLHAQHMCKNNQHANKDKLRKELPRHIGKGPAITRSQQRLRENLKFIYQYLHNSEVSDERKASVLEMLGTIIENCEEGYVDIVETIITGIVAPLNIYELVYRYKQSIVEQAASKLSGGVHNNNQFFKLAKQKGFGVNPPNASDHYRDWDQRSDAQISAVLDVEFLNKYTFFAVLNFLYVEIKSMLKIYGYIDEDDMVQNGKFAEVKDIVSRYYSHVKADNLEISDFFTDDCVYVDWKKIKTALLDSLIRSNIFILNNVDQAFIYRVIKPSIDKQESNIRVQALNNQFYDLFLNSNDFLEFAYFLGNLSDQQKLQITLNFCERKNISGGLVLEYLFNTINDKNDEFNKVITTYIDQHVTSAISLIKMIESMSEDNIKKACGFLRPFKFHEYSREAMLLAVHNGCLKSVKILVEKGVSIDLTSDNGQHIMHLAHKHDDILNFLIKNGANVSKQLWLTWAASEGRLEVVKTLLEIGADPRQPDKLGKYALNEAIKYPEICALLILNGATLDYDSWVKAALYNNNYRIIIDAIFETASPEIIQIISTKYISTTNNPEIIAKFILNGANINQVQWLVWAARKGHDGVIRTIMSLGCDVHAPDNNGAYAIIEALVNGKFDIAKTILENSLLPFNIGGKYIRLISSAPWLTDQKTIEQIFNILSVDSSMINIPSERDHKTALMKAVEASNCNIVRALLVRGASVEIRDHTGKTALDYAKKLQVNPNSKAIMKLLMQHGARIQSGVMVQRPQVTSYGRGIGPRTANTMFNRGAETSLQPQRQSQVAVNNTRMRSAATSARSGNGIIFN